VDAQMKRLRELTEQLSTHPYESHQHEEQIHDFNGMVRLRGLFSKDEVGVAYVFMAQGSNFPEHAHVAAEWLIVYKGEVKFTTRDDSGNETDTLAKTGDFIYLNREVGHSAEALVDSWLIAVTIPFEEGLPK